MYLWGLIETFAAAKVLAPSTWLVIVLHNLRQRKPTLIYLCICGCNCISHSQACLVVLRVYSREGHSYVVRFLDHCSKLCRQNLGSEADDHQDPELRVRLVEIN